MSGVQGAGGGGSSDQVTGMMKGIKEASGSDKLNDQANETTGRQQEAANKMNDSAQVQSQSVNPANENSGNDQGGAGGSSAYGASTDAAADAANRGL